MTNVVCAVMQASLYKLQAQATFCLTHKLAAGWQRGTSVAAFDGRKYTCKQADLDNPLFNGLDHLELFLRAQHILM